MCVFYLTKLSVFDKARAKKYLGSSYINKHLAIFCFTESIHFCACYLLFKYGTSSLAAVKIDNNIFAE